MLALRVVRLILHHGESMRHALITFLVKSNQSFVIGIKNATHYRFMKRRFLVG